MKRKYTKANEADVTAAVGEFIRLIRNGYHNPSMRTLLRKRGINSPSRAENLVKRMLKYGMIKEISDGFYELTQLNYESREIMPILLRRENNKPLGNPLAKFTPQQLVLELRNRGYEVVATREIRTVETL